MKKTNKNVPIVLLAALTVVLAIGGLAQQAVSDKAVDPVCGMTVVKANAKATYDYQGTTYYFCSTGCKDAFAKEPDKFLKAEQAKASGTMGHMGMMHGRQMGQGMGMACGPDCPLHGDDVEIVVENTKDGAALKFSSKNAETVKAIQEHLAEHVASMKKMKEAAAK